VADGGGDPGRDAGLEGDEQGAQAPRLPLRRADGLLRAHAGGRAGRRPRRDVLSLAPVARSSPRST
jgi:hypothetical protein